ncbi:MAG: hypothetical protein ABFS45_12790 [Pseudomonadota bacterium]
MSNKLSQEEQEILQSYENEEWVSVSNPSDIAKYKAAAKNTFIFLKLDSVVFSPLMHLSRPKNYGIEFIGAHIIPLN